MKFSWEWAQTFHAVAEQKSFSGAARALSVTQPTVSRRIRALEEHFGESLFDRDVEGAALTAAGLRLLPAAVEMARYCEELESIGGANGRRSLRGVITAGGSSLASEELFTALAIRLSRNQPNLSLEHQSQHHGPCDFRLSENLAVSEEEELLFRIRIETGVFAKAGTTRKLDNVELAELRWICAPLSNSGGEPERTLKSLGSDFAPGFTSNAREAQLKALKSGLGVMLLPRLSRSDELYGSLSEVQVQHCFPPTTLTLSQRRSAHLIAPIREAVEELTKLIDADPQITRLQVS